MLLQLPLFQSFPLLEQFHQHKALIDGSERERMERMEMRGIEKEIKENKNKEKESKREKERERKKKNPFL